MTVGDPLEAATDIGPMVDAKQHQRVQHFIDVGIEQGATLLYKGVIPTDPSFSDGYFVAPHVFGDVTTKIDDRSRGDLWTGRVFDALWQR